MATTMPTDFKYIDVHCQLDFPEYEADMEAVIERAQKAGVGIITVGTTREASRRAVEIAEKHEGVWAIVGVHPIHAHEEVTISGSAEIAGAFDKDFYMKLAQHPKVVGIGECGYDYFRVESSDAVLKAQHEAFVGQIEIANTLGKPLMLHLRNAKDGKGPNGVSAYADALKTLREFPGGLKVVGDTHFFAGTVEEAKEFIDLGFYVSFTGVITFARNYDEVIRSLPMERILSETDAPFVTPVPYRGKRNEPAYVAEVAHKIAEIRGESVEKVAAQLVENAKRLFVI